VPGLVYSNSATVLEVSGATDTDRPDVADEIFLIIRLQTQRFARFFAAHTVKSPTTLSCLIHYFRMEECSKNGRFISPVSMSAIDIAPFAAAEQVRSLWSWSTGLFKN
jgi:hypothetical protein